MSIIRAIEDTLPQISFTHWSSTTGYVFLRLAIFLVTAVRFFIGASVFFQAVHICPDHERSYPRRNYVLDFASALIHFSILYSLAVSIGSSPTSSSIIYLSQEKFFLALCAVLLYD